MSMYVPEIKEEVSENAKMLVLEEDGKVYRTSASIGGSKNTYYYATYESPYSVYSDPECTLRLTADGLLDTCLNSRVMLVYKAQYGTNYCNLINCVDNEDQVYMHFKDYTNTYYYGIYK